MVVAARFCDSRCNAFAFLLAAGQIFLLLRKLYLDTRLKEETTLPLASPPHPVTIRDSISLGEPLPVFRRLWSALCPPAPYPCT